MEIDALEGKDLVNALLSRFGSRLRNWNANYMALPEDKRDGRTWTPDRSLRDALMLPIEDHISFQEYNAGTLRMMPGVICTIKGKGVYCSARVIIEDFGSREAAMATALCRCWLKMKKAGDE